MKAGLPKPPPGYEIIHDGSYEARGKHNGDLLWIQEPGGGGRWVPVTTAEYDGVFHRYTVYARKIEKK